MSVTLLTRVLLNLDTILKSSTKMFTCLNVRYVAKGSCPGRVKNSMKRDMVRRESAYPGGYCNKCEKGFTWAKSYKKHMISFHNKKKPLKCSTCPKTFRTKNDLDQHLVRCPTNPNKKKPFSCDMWEG